MRLISDVRVFKVVVCSPSDVATERDEVEKAAQEATRILALAKRQVRIEVFRWETHVRPGPHEGGPQGRIDQDLEIETADVVVGIFWKRFGSPVRGAESGTEHELRRARRLWQSNHKPEVWTYFRGDKGSIENSEDAEQWLKVWRFREKWQRMRGGIVRSYAVPVDLRHQFQTDLLNYLFRVVPEEEAARATTGYLFCALRAAVCQIAGEGYAVRIPDVILHFRPVGNVAGRLIHLKIQIYINTPAITNRIDKVGQVTDAMIVSSEGSTIALGRSCGPAGLVFERVALQCPEDGSGVDLIIRNVRVNANGAGYGLGVASVVIDGGETRIELLEPRVDVAVLASSLHFSVLAPNTTSPISHPFSVPRISTTAPFSQTHLFTARFSARFKTAFEYRREDGRGTRFKLNLTVPPGLGVYVSTRALQDPEAAMLTESEGGEFSAITDVKCQNRYEVAEICAPAAITRIAACFWELLKNREDRWREWDFPVFVRFDPTALIEPTEPGTRLTVSGSLAPNATNGAFSSSTAGEPSTNDPIPRYADTSIITTVLEFDTSRRDNYPAASKWHPPQLSGKLGPN